MLAVSFGTSYDGTRERSIGAVEEEFRAACGEIPVVRAFTSRIIVSILKKRGVPVFSLEEAFQKLYEDGYEDIIVQPTVVIPGEEYERMREDVKEQEQRFARVRFGEALLMRKDDQRAAVSVLRELFPLKEGEALLFMGHGSEHPANRVYEEMGRLFREQGDSGIYVATVEAEPSLADIIPVLHDKGYKKIILTPLMLVAGDHAENDMAGDSEKSWKSVLEAEGFETEVILKGLGEYREIRGMYVEKLLKQLKGTFWGVSTGPGDPELMTVRALRILRQSDIVAAPETKGEKQTALAIAGQAMDLSDKQILRLKFEMGAEGEGRAMAYRKMAEEIESLLSMGNDVAMTVLGDASVYSTFSYLMEQIKQDGFPAAVCPGVTSFCAAAAALTIPLVSGNEVLTVIPDGIEDEEERLKGKGTRVIMKSGRKFARLKQRLEDMGLINRACAASECTMPNEKLYPELKEAQDTSGYFTTVIVRDKEKE